MIILSQSNDISLWGDLQAAAPADLHVRTLKLSDERPVALENGNMETVAMAIAHQHVSRVADVDSVREVGDVLASNAPHELPILIEHHNTMTLEDKPRQLGT